MMKIVICDDEQGVMATWCEQLAAIPTMDGSSIAPLTPSDLHSLIETLEGRRQESRSTKAVTLGTCLLDDVDVFIVDYDLLHATAGMASFITGENVAYLARCYSGVGVIIALNQFYTDNFFDLTLSSHLDSFADLNISDKQLANSGLWTADWPQGSFRPWHWPVVPDFVGRLARRVAALSGHLDEPITNYLSFPNEIVDFLDRKIVSFIATADKDIRDVTFRQFVHSSGQGLRGKDVAGSDELSARIAASRIGAWLERAVLASQDVLVDRPHLVERVPSVVGGFDNLEAVQHAIRLTDSASPLEMISDAEFINADWLSREAWWWPEIESAERLVELREPWTFAGLPIVFCEDTSTFKSRDEAQAFISGLPSPFARRFVSRVPGVVYRPQVRFARLDV
jgi:hypothetical protein